jgi:hypothetical protein
MKKLTRIACLATALVLAGLATASAWPNDGWTRCHYSCGQTVSTWLGDCCGTMYQCSNGDWGYALWWEQGPTVYCEI